MNTAKKYFYKTHNMTFYYVFSNIIKFNFRIIKYQKKFIQNLTMCKLKMYLFNKFINV